jgi:protein gp37
MNATRIDWADYSWGPVIGCTGKCPYCYARKMAHRFHMGRPDFAPVWVEKNFQREFPRNPSRIFVNSMSDLADWKPEWYRRVNAKMKEHPEHLFLFLTKRLGDCRWIDPAHSILGVSVTDQKSYDEISRWIGPRQFISIEPIHGPIILRDRVRWLIVGSETGNRKGKVKPLTVWVDDIYTFARENHIPIFFKKSLRPFWPARAYFPQEYLR